MSNESIDHPLYGWEIPTRELTSEEKNRKVTIDRLVDFHCSVGEDFLDQFTELVGSPQLFAGFVLGKYPEHRKEIMDHIKKNFRYMDVHCFGELEFYEFNDEENIDGIYFDFVEFLDNFEDTLTLEKINTVLILLDEYYNKK